MQKLPVLAHQKEDQKLFHTEREILYQVLFDMKKDVNELKKLVHDIMGGNLQMAVPVEQPDAPTYTTHPIDTAPIQEVETVDELLALDDVEKEMIRRALEKHNGRRKNAAAELKISERTLYRKIKEYGLD